MQYAAGAVPLSLSPSIKSTAPRLVAGEAGSLPDAQFVVAAGNAALSGLERQPSRHNAIVTALQDFPGPLPN